MARPGTRPTSNKTNYQSQPSIPASQKQGAEEQNYINDKINNSGLNEAWSSIVSFNDTYYPDPYTMTGPIEYTIDGTNAGIGNKRKDTITGDGNTITFTGFTIRDSTLVPVSNVVTTVATKVYTIVFERVGAVSEVYLWENNATSTGGGTAEETTYDDSGLTSGNLVDDKTNVQEAEAETRTWINSPQSALGTFNPAMVFDGQGQYDDYTQTGAITLTASGVVPFNMRVVRITADGLNDINFGSGIDKVITPFTNPLPAGSYWFYMASFVSPGGGSNGIHVNIPEVEAVVVTPPTISSMSVEDANPNDLVVVFNEVVTATNIGYSFRVDTVARTLTAISGSGTNTLTFTIDGAAIVTGEVLDLSYSQSTGDTRNAQLSELENFTQSSVTNNVLEPVLWSPADLGAKLKLWLEKGVGVTEAGTGVSVWADQSGNGYDFEQATDANRPSYNSGTGEITFNPLNSDELRLPTAKVSNFNTDMQGWLLIVGEKQTVNFSAFVAANDSIDTEYFIPIIYENAGADARDQHVAIVARKDGENTNTVFGDTTDIPINTAFNVLIESNGSSYEFYVGGVQQNVVGYDGGPDDGNWLGYIGSGLNQISIGALPRSAIAYYDIVVKEIIYGTTALTTQERDELITYASNV